MTIHIRGVAIPIHKSAIPVYIGYLSYSVTKKFAQFVASKIGIRDDATANTHRHIQPLTQQQQSRIQALKAENRALHQENTRLRKDLAESRAETSQLREELLAAQEEAAENLLSTDRIVTNLIIDQLEKQQLTSQEASQISELNASALSLLNQELTTED